MIYAFVYFCALLLDNFDFQEILHFLKKYFTTVFQVVDLPVGRYWLG